MTEFEQLSPELLTRLSHIKLLITDCDGVLTDNGVYYGENGEATKRFSIRDGMGVERLRVHAGVDTSIMTGENSQSVRRRAEKLKINLLYQDVKDKKALLPEVLATTGFDAKEIAYIGDDTNDLAIMNEIGFSATPSDGMVFTKEIVDYICKEKGGNGAFREVAELIIFAKNKHKQ
jgi:3-deoxy-D-manno-octulosonate 8-phosphate phosphatase (KDO 8-P phosphatase)